MGSFIITEPMAKRKRDCLKGQGALREGALAFAGGGEIPLPVEGNMRVFDSDIEKASLVMGYTTQSMHNGEKYVREMDARMAMGTEYRGPLGGYSMYGVMRLQFEDPKMQEYFEALPSKVRAFLRNSKIEISSPGELMMIGEHFKKELETPQDGRK